MSISAIGATPFLPHAVGGVSGQTAAAPAPAASPAQNASAATGLDRDHDGDTDTGGVDKDRGNTVNIKA